MKRTLSNRLTLSYMIIILAGMAIITPLTWLAVERLFLGSQKANLLAQAQLIASALSGSEVTSAGTIPYSQTANTSPGIHTRVIDEKGGVVIDLQATGMIAPSTALVLPQLVQNSTGSITLDELLSRSEIAKARQGQATTVIRRVNIAGGKLVLYAAAPVFSSLGDVTQIVYLATPLPDTRWSALPAAVRWQFAGVLLAAILIASGAGWIYARGISRPLKNLATAVHAVASGDLTQAVPEDKTVAELGILSRAFNSMTISLRQADQAKNAFIANVSHELRTPLTVIKGTIETLQDGAIDDLSARGLFLESMNKETERLIRLVSDLLVLTRADAGALKLQLRPVDLVDLTNSRCKQMERSASFRQVSLQVTVANPDDLDTFILADADRIAQILDNLLDNAIRYSLPEGSIQVIIGNDRKEVSCQVVDSGPGISPQHLPFIFDRFYRVDTARNRNQGGSGLGLAIVRGLVNAHGGHVTANSIEGQGTTITFWLPAFLPVE